MAFTHGHVPAHKGKSTTTDPIKDIVVVAQVKELLKDNVRDLALFTLAVNSAFRVGDLCNLTWDDCLDDGTTIILKVLEGKTKRPRVVPLNSTASEALRAWRRECNSPFVFSGQRGRMTTATFGRMVKDWCSKVGLQGSFAAHSTRKTWVRLQVDHFGTSLPVIMTAVGHRSEAQTLHYCGKLGDEVTKAYAHVL
jgi:integrase